MERTISLHDSAIEEVKLFCYLGNYNTHENKHTTEIKRRIALAKQAFSKMRNILTSRHISIRIKKLFIETFD